MTTTTTTACTTAAGVGSGRCRGDAGTTSINELMIAAGIAAIVTVIVTTFLVSAHVITVGVTERAIANRSASEVIQEFARVLRASRPLGHCTKDPSTGPPNVVFATPLGDCRDEGYEIEEIGPSVVALDADGDTSPDLCGYLRPAGTAGGGGTLEVPSMMCASIAENTLTFMVFEPEATATYTTPGWDTTPVETRLIGTVDQPGEVFSFRDSGGAVTEFPATVPTEQTVVVTVHPVVNYTDGRTEQTLTYDLDVALRGGRYLRDGFWTGDQQLAPGGTP